MSVVPFFVDFTLRDATVEDISEFTRDPIDIRRGRQDEADDPEPGTLNLELDNRDGRFSPRNPLGPYFGRLGQGALIRVRVESDNTGLQFRNGGSGIGHQGWIRTPDDASLDITADIDIRLDLTPDSWLGVSQILAAKFATGLNQRSWIITKVGTDLQWGWSDDGTDAGMTTLPQELPSDVSGRRTLRITHQSNVGGSYEVRFWTGTGGVDGTFTQLGTTQTGAATNIFSSTAPLALGATPFTPGITGFDGYQGIAHGFQVRSSVNGAVVAQPVLTDLEPWDTQTGTDPAFQTDLITDPTGKLWSLFSPAWTVNPFLHPPQLVLSYRPDIRAAMEVANWPQRWNLPDTDAFTPIVGAGILRRLGSLGQGVKDTVTRYISRQATVTAYDLINYWPLSDSSESFLEAASGIGGVSMRSLSVPSAPRFGRGDIGFWLPNAALTGDVDGFITGAVNGPAGGWAMDIMYRAPDPSGWEGDFPIRFYMEGLDSAEIQYRLTTLAATNQVQLQVINLATETTLNTTTVDSADLQDGQPHHIRLSATEEAGTNTRVRVNVDVTTFIDQTINIGVTATPGPRRARLGWDATGTEVLAVNFGQYSVWGPSNSIIGAFFAYFGYVNEPTPLRFARLMYEEGIPFAVNTDFSQEYPLMGPQPIANVTDLINDVASVDGGLIQERRDFLGLEMYPLRVLQNRPPDFTLQYDEQEIIEPLVPVEDDRHLSNDVIVRQFGYEFQHRAVDEVSPLGVNSVGRYENSVTVNVNQPLSLPAQSGHRLLFGTWNEARYTSVKVDLRNFEELLKLPLDREGSLALDGGKRIDIADLPQRLGADQARVMINGYEERIEDTHEITWLGTPYGPYIVGVVDDSEEDPPGLANLHPSRADTAGSELVDDVDVGTDTTMSVLTTQGPVWTTNLAEDVPEGLVIDGTAGAFASTPDDAAIDVVGDLEITVDAALVSWASGVSQTLVSKYDTGANERAYRLDLLGGGQLRLLWSTTGADTLSLDSTIPVPATPGQRVAIRVRLDVDQGGNHSLSVAIAPTAAGPFNQMGGTDTDPGVTTVFNSDASLVVGATNGAAQPAIGNIYFVEVRAGFSGTIGTNPDFAAQPAGTTSFADGVGRVWTISDTAQIADGGPELVLTEGGQEGARVLATAIAFPLIETFTRTTANSWGPVGAMLTGQSWALTGTAANFDINGTAGTIVGDAGGEFATVGSFGDVEILTRVSRSTLNGEIAAVLNWTDLNNYYSFELDYDTGSHDFSIWRRLAGVNLQLATFVLLGTELVVNTQYWIRARRVGSLLLMRVWENGKGEPAGWMLQATDTTHSSGAVGVGNFNATGLASFHDFMVTSPQTFTINQVPTNGVVKTVPAGSGVRLAQPMRPAL